MSRVIVLVPGRSQDFGGRDDEAQNVNCQHDSQQHSVVGVVEIVQLTSARNEFYAVSDEDRGKKENAGDENGN